MSEILFARLSDVPAGLGSGDLLSTNNLSELTNYPQARINLGLQIGVNVQAYASTTAAIAALTPTKGNVIVGNGSAWITLGVGTDGQIISADSGETSGLKWIAAPSGGGGSGAPTDASYVTLGTNGTLSDERVLTAGSGLSITDAGAGSTITVAVSDIELLAIAGLTSGANKLPYFTGSGTAALADLTAFARTVLDDADASAVQTTLGLVPGTNVQAYSTNLLAIAGLTSAADKVPYFTGSGTAAVADFTATARSLLDDSSTSAMRTTLGVVIGTNVQAWDADLDTIAAFAKTKGNIMVADGTNWALLPVGTNGQFFKADSAETTGVKWVTGSGGTGDVVGPSAATDTALAIYDSTTGKLLKDSVVTLSTSIMAPVTSDGVALGSGTKMFADLFLASGAVVNFNNGDVTVTHSADTLTLAGGSLVLPNAGLTIGASVPFSDSAGTLTLTNVDALDATTESTIEAAIDTLANLTSIQGNTISILAPLTIPADPNADKMLFWDDSAGATDWLALGNSIAITTTTIDTIQDIRTTANPQFATIELGAASDTTVARSSAGVIMVEGVVIPSISSTNTLTNKTLTSALITTKLSPTTDDGAPLGDTTHNFSDLFLASGAVINFANSNATITHSSGLLTFSTAISIGTSNAITVGTIELGAASDTTIARASAGVASIEGNNIVVNTSSPTLGTITTTGTIELGNASDTTVARSSAGVISVEGVVIPSISSTNTLTNKRVTPRTANTTSSATPTINTDNVELYLLTAQAGNVTSFTTNLSGTPTEGQRLTIAITGTATRTLSWGSSFEASTVPLPTTTVSTARLDVGFIWNSVTGKWRCVAVA